MSHETRVIIARAVFIGASLVAGYAYGFEAFVGYWWAVIMALVMRAIVG